MIGRVLEIEDLQRAYDSDQSEFVAVYGRRRVGKTYLINETFHDRYAFHTTGIESGTKREQLESFWEALRKQGLPKCRRPQSWIGAFSALEDLLESLPEGKKVVFLDELPWFDSHKSGFLRAFEAFWNGWCALRKDILLIVCGSATTWIVKKILRSRGGLHNRVTRQMPLAPFTLAECEEYAAYRKLNFNRQQLLECYMAFGGVAYYWSLLRAGLSAAQNFDLLFFGPSNEMRDEYGKIFAALFKTERRHVAVIRLLGTRKIGLTRDEIAAKLGAVSGGDLSACLEELESCGFVRKFTPVGKIKKGAVYQLIDNYILFYFEFLEQRTGNDERYWTHHYREPRLNTWRGRAFERVCFWHIPQIKAALGISGIAADVYSWYGKGSETERPIQVDMVIERADNTVSLCEMKYAADEFELKAAESENIRRRVEGLSSAFKRRKAVQTVLVTTNGLKPNKYAADIHRVVTADRLFVPLDLC